MILIKTGETYPFSINMFNTDDTPMDLTNGLAKFVMYNETAILVTDTCTINGNTVNYLLKSSDALIPGNNYFEIRLWIGTSFSKEIATGGIIIYKTELTTKPVV